MGRDYVIRRRVRSVFAPCVDDNYQLAREEEAAAYFEAKRQRQADETGLPQMREAAE